MSLTFKVWLSCNALLVTVWLQTIHSFVFSSCTCSFALSSRNQVKNAYRSSEFTYNSHSNEATSEVVTPEENTFQAHIERLCEERNIPFEQVKNARDFSSPKRSPIKPGCIYRMGLVSDATEKDAEFLMKDIGIKTLIDLRSPTELKEDPTLHSNSVFDGFTSVTWKNGKNTEIPNYPRKSKKKSEKVSGKVSNSSYKESIKRAIKFDDFPNPNRKERHFVSLINELKYIKGTMRKLRKRDKVKAFVQLPGAIVSRRVRHRVKDVFLSVINGGGLPMLNELLLDMGAPGIKHVLDLIADKNRHPIALYCTAGKDRTGVIAAIVLSIVDVPDEDIVEDYSLSAKVYAQINDHSAMVGALSQRNLNPETFLGAPPHVMRETLKNIRNAYGSVNGYLDSIGFGEGDREKLKQALLDK